MTDPHEPPAHRGRQIRDRLRREAHVWLAALILGVLHALLS